MHPFPQLWLTTLISIPTLCLLIQQFLCNFRHLHSIHILPSNSATGVFAILTYTNSESAQSSDLRLQTPTRESLTFVVTLLDQVAWLHSGYCYSSPTMISIINRVLGSTFLEIHCFDRSRCHPPLRHSVVDTLCGTSRPCSGNPGQSSRPSETLIPQVKPLNLRTTPFLQQYNAHIQTWDPWFVSNSGSPQDHLMSIILNYFEHLEGFFNFFGQPPNSNSHPKQHPLLVDVGTSTF